MRFFRSILSGRKNLVRAGIAVSALALIATVGATRERTSPQAVEPAAGIDARVRPAGQDLDLSALFRAPGEARVDPAHDPFAPRSFASAAPPAAAAGKPAPRPSAPPLPFSYLGKALEDGKLSVFLARGDDNYSLSPGAKRKIGEYRVDKVTESQVTFTYLPLKTRQTLDIPAVH